MNFLAHAFLAHPSVPLIVGNFIADFVKGKQIEQYDDGIVAGMIMHRNIDTFTDNHPVFKQSKNRIREKYNHYSGVIIDLYYDHFLAKNWEDYSDISLQSFTLDLYDIILEKENIIPEKARYMLPFMVKSNWLLNYGTIEGIDRSLTGLSRRTNFKSGMEYASNDLLKHYNELENDFRDFFPDIIDYINQ